MSLHSNMKKITPLIAGNSHADNQQRSSLIENVQRLSKVINKRVEYTLMEMGSTIFIMVDDIV